jgi:hypothetical protein
MMQKWHELILRNVVSVPNLAPPPLKNATVKRANAVGRISVVTTAVPITAIAVRVTIIVNRNDEENRSSPGQIQR